MTRLDIPLKTSLFGAKGTAYVNTPMVNSTYWRLTYRDGLIERAEFLDVNYGLLMLDISFK